MMKSRIVVLGGLLLAAPAMAQDAKPPALLAKGEDGQSAPLRVDEVDVAVNVVGNVAETVMTLRFRNDTERLEKLFELYTKMTTKDLTKTNSRMVGRKFIFAWSLSFVVMNNSVLK